MPLVATFDELHTAGCIQTGADVHEDVNEAKKNFRVRFFGLMGLTLLDPCTSGCPAFPECPAFKQFFVGYEPPEPQKAKKETPEERQARIDSHIKPKGTARYPGMSVRQIAKETGLSIKQVRRRKISGAV